MPRRACALLLAIWTLAAASACGAIGMRTIEAGTEPPPFTAPGFPHDLLDGVLRKVVGPTGVDYPALVRDSSALRAYCALLAVAGPATAPERFPSAGHRLAYYLNAYNAFVLLGVVEHWPIESVREVRAALAPGGGFGFFYGLRFRLDGHEINLHDLENEILRMRFDDARIHAAINCASISCPRLRRAAWSAATLESELDAATLELTSDPRHVRFDHEAKVVHLSALYDWYREDFERHAERAGRAPAVLAFIALFGGEESAAAAARAGGYELRTMDYDWRLNGS